MHGYDSYMKYAWPADELMPLSCAGRVRGVTPSRGDVDDSLGKWVIVNTLFVCKFNFGEAGIMRISSQSDLCVSLFRQKENDFFKSLIGLSVWASEYAKPSVKLVFFSCGITPVLPNRVCKFWTITGTRVILFGNLLSRNKGA